MTKPKPQVEIAHAQAIAELEEYHRKAVDDAIEAVCIGALSGGIAKDVETIRAEIDRLRARQIGPAQAADILTAVIVGSINPSTFAQLQKIRGEMPRPARERPTPHSREEFLEIARERLRWAEQDPQKSFVLIHGAIDSNRKMQVSFIDSNNHDVLLMLEAARILWHEAHGVPIEREPDPPDQGCDKPPKGWYCSRIPGHEGACAARPTG